MMTLMHKSTKLRDSLMFTRTIITACSYVTIGNLRLTWLDSKKCELLHNYGGVISTDAKNASTTFDLHTYLLSKIGRRKNLMKFEK